jgi:3-deoxy-D-manno-octulosonic-acid transferase
MPLLYTLSIHFYHFLIRIGSLFNAKAKLWVEGRHNIFDRLQSEIPQNAKIAWFHCASLGEFEQGRPVIETFRKEHPDFKILLTFFSPSGYEIRRKYDGADWVFYLPIDTPHNANRFLGIVDPAFAAFIKYEYWFNYMKMLNRKGIPLIVISAIFRPGQRFFRWWGGWQREMLSNTSHFFVQNKSSEKLLKNVGINQVTLSGDTRFDRVYEVARQKKPFPLIEKFGEGHKILLAGSTWPQDEEVISSFIRSQPKGVKFIFAPHEVHDQRIQSLISKLPGKCLRFSEANDDNIATTKILIIDSIGILSHLYQYATVAYIGGGFGVGIHNILEAATFGNPVIFGPNYEKFHEAKDLIRLGGAFSISSENQFRDILEKLLTDDGFNQKASRVSIRYVEDKRGATEQIIEFIDKKLLKKK